ncbi:MAG: DUF4062 domain-containing protein, partial [Anaerolineae bacterium]|nr:DUF4062 domain-containing protein [Anaerolineae bacterium]
PDHRKQAEDAVSRALMSAWTMEHLTATLGDAISVSLELVDKSEIYIGIIGMRYGYIPDDPARNPQRLSVTELEYRRARERGIPVLLYLMHPDHPVPPRKAGEADTFTEQSAEGIDKLKSLKAEMEKNHVVGYFRSPEELRALIIQSLHDPDVIKAAEAKASESDKPTPTPDPLGIPRPPQLYSLPPYALTNTFIGRAAELRMLDEWARGDQPVMVIEAIGGMGKSALTWEWVRQQAAAQRCDGIIWYSFYEGGAQMRDCLRHALAYITQQNPDDLKSVSQEDLMLRLLPLLSQGRWLLALDGLERVLVAYHRLDAAQVRDDQVQRDLRDCISEKDNRLLQKLATVTKTRVLVSSRLMPRALENAGDPIPGVRRVTLKGLHPDDALRLMADRGVQWDDATAIDGFMKQIGYHGLLLKIVAGRIKTHRRARGHFETWYEIDGRNLKLFDLTDEHRRTHILADAFEGLSDEKRKLLSQIAAFSDSVDYETISIFNPYPGKRAAADFDAALTELEDRGLLQWDRDTDRYELHPVVRGYSFERLEDHAATFSRIHDIFVRKPRDNYKEAKSLVDLRNSIEIYRALVGSNQYERAISFYRDRFSGALLYNVSDYETIVELLRSLFLDPLVQTLHSRIRPHSASYIRNMLSIALRNLGRTEDALKQLQARIELGVNNGYVDDLAVGLSNLTYCLADLNQLAKEDISLRLAEKVFSVSGDLDGANSMLPDLVNHYCIVGDWDNAEGAYQTFRASPIPPRHLYRPGEIEDRWARVLFYRNIDPRSVISKGLNLASQDRAKKVQMQLLALTAQVELSENNLVASEDMLDQALAIARQSGHVNQTSYTALLAQIQAARGETALAQTTLADALAMINVPGERAAIYNSAGRVALAAGDHQAAQDYALTAYRYAWADGPPYIRWYDLKQARELLARLGVPEPSLPPFDPASVEKIPYEDEIRALIAKLEAEKRQ